MNNARPREGPPLPRFAQLATFMRLPHVPDPKGLDVAILGIPYDGGVTYRPGPRFGPADVRQHSRLIRTYHPVHGIKPFEALRVADVGDVRVNPMDVQNNYARIETAVGAILDAGAVPVCVGGDHSVSLGLLRAVARQHGAVGLVHVDAHQDMWDEHFGNRYFHGAPFRRAVEEGLLDTRRAIQIGIRGSVNDAADFDFARQHRVRTIRGEDVAREGIAWVIRHLQRLGRGPVYLSFDIDGVDPAFAPGTGTPEVGGLTSREAMALIRALKGVRLVGADLVEVSPPYDHSHITSLLAANLLFEIVSVIAATRAEKRRRRPGPRKVGRKERAR
ncbi:MAG: agmatinase [Armatimonadetes bacterium]|nr:agmatinase [Armatimonadota bacterium]